MASLLSGITEDQIAIATELYDWWEENAPYNPSKQNIPYNPSVPEEMLIYAALVVNYYGIYGIYHSTEDYGGTF